MPIIGSGGGGSSTTPGPAGADGYTPIKGVDYFDGLPGAPSTIPGPPGSDGCTPIKGVDYFDGAPGLASTVPGPKGDKGDTGAASIIPGPPGADSIVPGPKGDTGNQGIQGLPGAPSTVPGPKGDTGDAGGQGIQGIQGIQGVKGDTGTPGGQPLGYVVLTNDTLAQALATNINTQLTVTAARTLTTTVPEAGVTCSVVIVTSGTTSYTITFGTGFKPVGTLATGTTSARAFQITFRSNGTVLREVCRTAAMVV